MWASSPVDSHHLWASVACWFQSPVSPNTHGLHCPIRYSLSLPWMAAKSTSDQLSYSQSSVCEYHFIPPGGLVFNLKGLSTFILNYPNFLQLIFQLVYKEIGFFVVFHTYIIICSYSPHCLAQFIFFLEGLTNNAPLLLWHYSLLTSLPLNTPFIVQFLLGRKHAVFTCLSESGLIHLIWWPLTHLFSCEHYTFVFQDPLSYIGNKTKNWQTGSNKNKTTKTLLIFSIQFKSQILFNSQQCSSEPFFTSWFLFLNMIIFCFALRIFWHTPKLYLSMASSILEVSNYPI